jgi:hypothetical protein
VPRYDARGLLLHRPYARRFELLIVGRSFDNQPFDGLLGRDVLNQCHLGWRGPAQTLRLEYE